MKDEATVAVLPFYHFPLETLQLWVVTWLEVLSPRLWCEFVWLGLNFE